MPEFIPSPAIIKKTSMQQMPGNGNIWV